MPLKLISQNIFEFLMHLMNHPVGNIYLMMGVIYLLWEQRNCYMFELFI